MAVSVQVERWAGVFGVRMVWPHEVDKADVRLAFCQLLAILDERQSPVYVLVDLRADPQFPMHVTVKAALSGPYKHAMLARWLVVGANPVAKTIGRTLLLKTGRANIGWFQTEADALAHLQAPSG